MCNSPGIMQPHLCIVEILSLLTGQLRVLKFNKMNIKSLMAFLAIVWVFLIAGCKKDDFNEIIGICPLVVSTDPINGATNVPLFKVITATFNEEINPETINEFSFTITGGSPVKGAILYSGLTATFIPFAPLKDSTTYTGRITRMIKDLDGNALQTDYVWTFSTGVTLSPIVIVTDPFNLETGVVLDKQISATFNVPMDPNTINNNSFILKDGFAAVEGFVTFNGLTAFFTPIVPLKPNTTYTGILTSSIKNEDGTSLASNYEWTFTTITFVAPFVISTDPTNNETGVALNKIITATFSVPMDPLTLTAFSFTINQGDAKLLGAITYSGNVATFTPTSPLSPNTTYTGTIYASVKDLNGINMTSDYIWVFSTGSTVSPTVISTDPQNNAFNVVLSKRITATFSEPMDPSTINSTSFTLRDNGILVAGAVTFSNRTATFVPASPLKASTIYTGTITTGAKNLSGVALAKDYVWTFTTVSNLAPLVISTDPASNATNVSLNKIVTATFNMSMDPLTINSNTFTLKQGVNSISGTILYSGNTASFIPTNPLKSNTTYTGTITTGAKNLFGIALASNYNWSFTTVTVVAPTVVSTDPENNAINVPVNKILTATFSQVMDPLTINAQSFILRQGNQVIPGLVTYKGLTATFTPVNVLNPNLTYTATITTLAKNIPGVPLNANYVWTFKTTTIPAPTVISTDPTSNAINVSLNKVISANFSTLMDPTTINTSSFLVRQGSNTIAGTVSYIGTTASFVPTNPLKSNTLYTVTITSAVKSIMGVSMAANYVWSFTTVTVLPPTVISTDPINNAINVSLNKIISASFSVPMDPTTIIAANFIVKLGSIPIAGIVNYTGVTATFTPTAPLKSNSIYTVTLTTGMKIISGVSLANNYVWTFTTMNTTPPTVVSIDPINNATGVILTKIISAEFSVPMDPSTINSSSFNLKQGGNLVAGTITYSGTTLTFIPSSKLLPLTVYTATINTLAKNLAGIPLAADYVWTFTTRASLNPPLVVLGSVERFGIIAGAGVSNQAGFSEIHNMDVGIYPGFRSSITGFPPAIVVNGAIFAADDIAPPGVPDMLLQAKRDLSAAYNFAAGASNPAPITVSGDQGGLTLAPGIYKSTSTLLIASGDLTLDAQGDPSAVWIFQIASGFTTIGGAGGNVILSGGAQASNVFWQVGSSATIGDFTSFQGNILALTSVTMNSGAQAEGRMLCINGAVVLTSTNIINRP